jgi:nucleotide-binding universal stress UspA family protein
MQAYRVILVDAGLDPVGEARVRLAAGVAKPFGARLIGLAAGGIVPPVTGPFGETAMVVDLVEGERQRVAALLDAAAGRFRAVAGASAEWRGFIEYPGDALAREARAADLLVIGRGGPEGEQQAAEPSDVVIRAGHPVLVVPPGVDALAARRVVVGWKDGRPARRAVADALPFLVAAEQVLVLAVREDADRKAPAERQVGDVVAWLARHGARASGEVAVASNVADALFGAAGRLEADLIVAGGYGSAPMLEWVLGGVTRDLLARCPVCCLLSH